MSTTHGSVEHSQEQGIPSSKKPV